MVVGAFGAIQHLLGWVAATGEFGIEAGTLFFDSVSSFWAIGWFCMRGL
jgi:protoheme IX farnesyltransferase